MPGPDTDATARARARFLAVAVGVVVVGAAGYLGAFAGRERDATTGVVALAAGTGFAAFFSPCSFPLLLTFLTGQAERGLRSALPAALRIGLGAALLLAALGGAVAAGSTGLGEIVQFDSGLGRTLRGAIGAGLVGLGAYQFGLVRWRAKVADRVAAVARRLPTPRPGPARDLAYGFGYLVAGFG